jgi:hypothetical protein
MGLAVGADPGSHGPEDNIYNPSRPRRPNAPLRHVVNLSNNLRNHLYARALKIWEDDTIGTCYLACGLKAAKEVFVSVSTTDRPVLNQQIYRRATAMGNPLKFANAAASISPDHSVYPSFETCNINGDGSSLSGTTSGCGPEGEVGPETKGVRTSATPVALLPRVPKGGHLSPCLQPLLAATLPTYMPVPGRYS